MNEVDFYIVNMTQELVKDMKIYHGVGPETAITTLAEWGAANAPVECEIRIRIQGFPGYEEVGFGYGLPNVGLDGEFIIKYEK